MPWVEVFVVLWVCHQVGDYVFQTEWQALNKRGGLSKDATRRSALLQHTFTYTLAFVPALIWLSDSLSLAGLVGIAALIAVPHMIQDDGRLLTAYAQRVKKADITQNPGLGAALDQALHLVALFLTALVAAS